MKCIGYEIGYIIDTVVPDEVYIVKSYQDVITNYLSIHFPQYCNDKMVLTVDHEIIHLDYLGEFTNALYKTKAFGSWTRRVYVKREN